MNHFERTELNLAHTGRLESQAEVQKLTAKLDRVLFYGIPAAIVGGFVLGLLAAYAAPMVAAL